MTKKATSQDVAAAAGVSQTAVSLILNNSGRISFSRETRERVFRAARSLDYHLPRRRVQREETAANHLLVLTSSPDDFFGAELSRAAQKCAAGLGWHTVVCSTFRSPEQEKEALEMYLPRRANAVLYTCLPAQPHLAEHLSVPAVIIGEKAGGCALRCVEINCAAAGFLLADRLLRLGHRRAAYLSMPFEPAVPERRCFLDGMRRRFAEAQLPDAPEVFTGAPPDADSPAGGPLEFAAGRLLAGKLLERGTDATVLVGAGDFTALGILCELQARGLRVPDDFSVCGFGGSFFSAFSGPALTTVDLRLPALAEAAVRLLAKKSRGAAAPLSAEEAVPRPCLLPGASAGPAPRR
jgi:LacI family transcriptional regulator